jgi:hypothetical protein
MDDHGFPKGQQIALLDLRGAERAVCSWSDRLPAQVGLDDSASRLRIDGKLNLASDVDVELVQNLDAEFSQTARPKVFDQGFRQIVFDTSVEIMGMNQDIGVDRSGAIEVALTSALRATRGRISCCRIENLDSGWLMLACVPESVPVRLVPAA